MRVFLSLFLSLWESSGMAICGAVLVDPFSEYPAIEYENFPLPADWNQKAEWTRARLRVSRISTAIPTRMLVYNDGRPFPGYWTMDYPRSDRHLRRRCPAADANRLMVGGTGSQLWRRRHVQLSDALCGRGGALAAKGRERKTTTRALLRGGFLMVDDFHGPTNASGPP